MATSPEPDTQAPKKWSAPLKIAYWNCNGVGADWDGNSSRKLEEIIQTNRYDFILLCETHIRSFRHVLDTSHNWVFSDPVDDKDPSAGTAIWISPRAMHIVQESGHIGSRLTWLKIQTNLGTTVLCAHYIAHMFRENPSREDCFKIMEKFLRDTVKTSERLVYCTDANSRMARNVTKITGKYCLHHISDEGGKRLLDICRTFGLCAPSTMFRPNNRHGGKLGSAATYVPRDPNMYHKKAQIDYILVKQRFLSDITNCQVKWAHSIRFNKRFDHGILEVDLKLRVAKRFPSAPPPETPGS